MDKEVEIKTVDTILDKGVRAPIPSPLFLRMLGVRHIRVTVRRPTINAMLRISRLYLQLGIKEDAQDWPEWMAMMASTGKDVSRIVAVGMLRDSWRCALFSRPLAAYMREHMDLRQLAELSVLLVTCSGVQDFMNTIKFLKLMKITEAKNLSQ